jgi:hypothetical protein
MIKSNSKGIVAKFRKNDNRCAMLEYSNYCVSGIMSRCSAGSVWLEQRKCKFSKKSSVSERCMHYIVPLDGHCDCVDAQIEMRKLASLDEDDK